MLSTIKNYLGQPGTWRGLIYILTAAGVSLSTDQQEAIVAAGLAAAGLVHVFWPKK